MTAVRELRPRPVTADAFAPYGDVLDRSLAERRTINEGTATRFHRMAAAEAEGGGAVVSIFRGTSRGFPFGIRMMERHPLGSQAFFPLSPRDWLAVVAPDAGGEPDPAGLECFLVRGDQGVQYGRGVWHHPLLVLEEEQDFLVVDRDGPGGNLVEHAFGREVARVAP